MSYVSDIEKIEEKITMARVCGVLKRFLNL